MKLYSQRSVPSPDHVARVVLTVPGQKELDHLLPLKLPLQPPEIPVTEHPEHSERENRIVNSAQERENILSMGNMLFDDLVQCPCDALHTLVHSVLIIMLVAVLHIVYQPKQFLLQIIC